MRKMGLPKELPKNWHMKDGRVVSGYDRLPREVLEAEGWRLDEQRPRKNEIKPRTVEVDIGPISRKP